MKKVNLENLIAGSTKVLNRTNLKTMKGGFLTSVAASCAPGNAGAACLVDGVHGRCVGFACSPNCIHG